MRYPHPSGLHKRGTGVLCPLYVSGPEFYDDTSSTPICLLSCVKDPKSLFDFTSKCFRGRCYFSVSSFCVHKNSSRVGRGFVVSIPVGVGTKNGDTEPLKTLQTPVTPERKGSLWTWTRVLSDARPDWCPFFNWT